MSMPVALIALQFLINGDGVVHRHLFVVFVEIVLHLLRQRERAGQRDLGGVRRLGDEERGVARLDRALPLDLPRHARHRHGARAARAARRRAGIGEVDALERQREPVGIAFAANLAVGDDVDAGLFEIVNREPRRVVLRRFALRFRNAPHLRRADAWNSLRRFVIDEPARLRIGTDDGGGKSAANGQACRTQFLGYDARISAGRKATLPRRVGQAKRLA